ncbi:(p)ppGpp synthetase [Piscinibacter gummiphilus]|uniref:(P)ppGpp synthetase n=1 Tax=Piscinibacter gummiphilus TaxID=946333 RepID=A0ABZ0D1N2_9BURK|nr:(p)ppGpp synthetase [Piscinibacter gummiphilus]WOB09147.1 (p)ppGpp synthetase [Piscinibacter gummiphilus]
MPSLDFEQEKARFRAFYERELPSLRQACELHQARITAILDERRIAVAKIDARVKDREESIRKFVRKYLTRLEDRQVAYEIAPHVSDLIGLRIVCLYEDELDPIADVLRAHFDVLGVSDKASEMESTEGLFGYKGLHLDLRAKADETALTACAQMPFEIQLRTIIQDSWSVLDHKIKYKKSIPIELKRRINRLAALFELADEEFRSIRVATTEALQEEALVPEPAEAEAEAGQEAQTPPVPRTDSVEVAASASKKLNVFNFLRVAQHYFRGYEFEAHKVDGFVQDVVGWQPGITKGQFNEHMRAAFWRVKQYKQQFENGGEAKATMNPFTVIRHCLYLADKEHFARALSSGVRRNFEAWLAANPLPPA